MTNPIPEPLTHEQRERLVALGRPVMGGEEQRAFHTDDLVTALLRLDHLEARCRDQRDKALEVASKIRTALQEEER